MKKQDYIDLIKVAEAITKLDKVSKMISGSGLDEGDAGAVFCIWDVLRRNAAPKYHYTDDMEQDLKNYHSFYSILEDPNLSYEEKYSKLMEL